MSILYNLDTRTSERVVVSAAYDNSISSALDPFFTSLAADDQLQQLFPRSAERLARRTITTSGHIVDALAGRDPSPIASSSGMFSPTATVAQSSYLFDSAIAAAVPAGAFAVDQHSDSSNSDSSAMFDLRRLALDDQRPSPPVQPASQVQLLIVEQPSDKFRFRYKSEMHGTHGSLTGASGDGQKKKTCPTVQLQGYDGPAVVRCSLHQTDERRARLHSHLLVIRNNNEDQRDPHTVNVGPEHGGYRVEFPGMGIIHTAKRCVINELHDKLVETERLRIGRELTELECERLRLQAESDSKGMDLNRVCLCFQAYRIDGEQYQELCPPVYSRPINNMKSAMTGELKITRLSAVCCDAGGGTDLFLFVEKVGKKNIKVRFFEQDERGKTTWEAFGQFSESDVHHQYAIALRTPPYRDRDIEEPVDVFMQLFRESDRCYSEPKPFRYKPRNQVKSRKRARLSSALNSAELPTVLQGAVGNVVQSTSAMLVDTISAEYNTMELLNSLMNSTATDPLLSDRLNSMIDEDVLHNVDRYEAIMDAEDRLLSDGVPATGALRPNAYGAMVTVLRQKIENVSRTLGRPKACEYLQKIWRVKNVHSILINALAVDESVSCQIIDLLADYEQLALLNEPSDQDPQYAMHAVCLYNRTGCLERMLQLGVDPNVLDAGNNTPLHVAVAEANVDCVRLLCRLAGGGALRIDATNDDGCTPLHLAIRPDSSVDIVHLLTEAGASTTKLEERGGNNALHLAVQCNSRDLVQHLMTATDVQTDARNSSSLTAAEMAGMNACDSDILRMLGCAEPTSADGEPTMVVQPVAPVAVAAAAAFEPMVTSEPLFDDIGLQELCALLNVDGRWSRFADQLNIGKFVDHCATGDDPARAMFRFAELNGLQLQHMVNAFVEMNDLQALGVLDEMIARRLERE